MVCSCKVHCPLASFIVCYDVTQSENLCIRTEKLKIDITLALDVVNRDYVGDNFMR